MNINEIINAMESLAPKALSLSFDNPGLLIGTDKEDIKRILVALDCTLPVAKEAHEQGCDLIITHHPLFFNPIKHILPDDPETAAAFYLIKHGIAMFAAHTNLDAAQGGVNDALGKLLGLSNIEPLPPENLGRVGKLPEPMSLYDFTMLVNKKLNTKARVSPAGFSRDIKNITVSRIALIGGSGGSDYKEAYDAGADVLLTGEVKHSQAIEAATLGISVIQAGHYETEAPVLPEIIKHLQKTVFGVQLKIASADYAVLTTPV